MKKDQLSETFNTFKEHQIMKCASGMVNGGETYCIGGDGLGNTLQIIDYNNGTATEQRDTEKVVITKNT